jgi:hypothetical protein
MGDSDPPFVRNPMVCHNRYMVCARYAGDSAHQEGVGGFQRGLERIAITEMLFQLGDPLSRHRLCI